MIAGKDVNVNEMVRYFYLNKSLGYKRAKQLWYKCKFVNGENIIPFKHTNFLAYIKLLIDKSLALLNVICSDDEIEEIIKIGNDFQNETFEKTLADIELKNRPVDVIFDDKAIINLTRIHVPNDILLVLSWGNKFVFPRVLDHKAMPIYLSQIEHTMSVAINTAQYNDIAMRIKKKYNSTAKRIPANTDKLVEIA